MIESIVVLGLLVLVPLVLLGIALRIGFYLLTLPFRFLGLVVSALGQVLGLVGQVIGFAFKVAFGAGGIVLALVAALVLLPLLPLLMLAAGFWLMVKPRPAPAFPRAA